MRTAFFSVVLREILLESTKVVESGDEKEKNWGEKLDDFEAVQLAAY